MAVIEIICKSKSGKSIIIDDANNKKDANQQVDYWKSLKGNGWKISTRVK